MPYRLTKDQLFEVLEEWNRRLKRRVHLIACGGTAMTLLGISASILTLFTIRMQTGYFDYVHKVRHFVKARAESEYAGNQTPLIPA